MKLDYRYYLTQDGKRIVREGDKAAYSLMYPAGTEITQDEADRWGLKKPTPVTAMPEAPQLDRPAATKVVKPTSKEGR